MRTIKIGNDIKVLFKIKNIDDFDQMNIKQMRVYFVNQNSSSTSNCVKRFPREPFPQFYTPSEYTLHNCGRFEYNVTPCYNKCEYAYCFPGFNDYHLWDHYNGFGVKPEHFCEPHHHCCDEPLQFLAPSVIESGKNEVSSYFPACEQKFKGVYKMIVILVMYEDGWCRNNLHTYTIDYGTIFELSDEDSAENGKIIIDLRDGEDTPVEPTKQSYIGFDISSEPSTVNLNNFTKKDNIYGDYEISNNTGNWAFLWIFSQKPINKLTVSGFQQPLQEIKASVFPYCYRTNQELDQTSYTFKIE